MPGLFVASPTGSMTATGSGTVESQAYSSAIHTGITHEFHISLPKNHGLFTAFSYADVVTSDGETDFTVDLSQNAFEAALVTVLTDASGGKWVTDASGISTITLSTNQSSAGSANVTGSVTAENTLDAEIRAEVETELNNNGVLEYLEGNSLSDFDLVLNVSGGAHDMYTKLTENSFAALRNLFLQIPNRVSEANGETDASGARLPVVAGDRIAFVYSVSPSVTITQVDESSNVAGANANSGEALGTGNMGGADTKMNSSILTTGTRKLAFVVTVGAAQE